MSIEVIKQGFANIFATIQAKAGSSFTEAQMAKLGGLLGMDLTTLIQIQAGSLTVNDAINNVVTNSTPEDLLAKTKAIINDPELGAVIKNSMADSYDAVIEQLNSFETQFGNNSAVGQAAGAAGVATGAIAANGRGPTIIDPFSGAAPAAGAGNAGAAVGASVGGGSGGNTKPIDISDTLAGVLAPIGNAGAMTPGYFSKEGTSDTLDNIGTGVKNIFTWVKDLVKDSGPLGQLAVSASFAIGIGSWLLKKDGNIGNLFGSLVTGVLIAVIGGTLLGIGKQGALAGHDVSEGNSNDGNHYHPHHNPPHHHPHTHYQGVPPAEVEDHRRNRNPGIGCKATGGV